ncbi:MAG TPA: hypothetical protein VH394_08185 [Thermoanaerobaculia bacterium]|jgi:hypothetical protein|nr:hypothetical protein [Thermoanaerobaculia bacterium]
MKTKLFCALVLSCCLFGFAMDAGAAVTYHGGPVIVVAKVVDIFWGPSFANPASPDYIYAQSLTAFRNQFGTSPEYNVITQYYQIVGGVRQYIQLSNLAAGTADWFDTSTPPTNVTDTAVRAEIQRYLATHAFDSSTIYEVFLPSASYSSYGSGTSCGGPALAYCTYHNFYGSGATAVKYTVQPYASCAGCQIAGWTAAQNQEHFVANSTRATVTDPLFNAWYDSTGMEMGDKCLWMPAPFLDGVYGYPYEWSNAVNACVKKR